MSMIFYLGLVLLAGIFVAKVLRYLHFPNVTGYLIAGVIIGPSVLNLIPETAVSSLSFVSEVALGFIAFSIGGVFRLHDLKKQGLSTILITCMEALTAFVCVFMVLLLALHTEMSVALMIGAIACATAPAATIMIIRQYNAHGPLVDTLLPVVALDDAVSIIAFGVASSVAHAFLSKTGIDAYTMLINPLCEIGISLGVGLALGLLLVLFLKFSRSEGNFVNLEIAVVFIGIALSQIFHVSSLLLCMALGAVVANATPNPVKVFGILDPITTPIFLAFFTISGASLDIGMLAHVGLIGVSYFVVRSAGKWLGAFASCKLCKKPTQVTKYLGIALMPQAGVALGLSLTAANMIGGAAGQQVRTVIVATTVVYELIGPLAAKFALKHAREIR
ncbi:MAG: cation:proton antiporter [Spirochaetaceae bacterium]|nr:cation:proton antiporter [Spirochaetaceae bacterium]